MPADLLLPAAPAVIRAERCETCRFGVAARGQPLLACHRNPPVPFPMQGPGGAINVLPLWAPCPPDEWCGEWRSRATAIGL